VDLAAHVGSLTVERLERARRRAAEFLKAAEVQEGDFALARSGTPGLFPRAIAVFGAALLGCIDELRGDRDLLASKLRADLRWYFQHRRVAQVVADKPLMQALAFTLSALAALGRLDEDPLDDLVRPLLPVDVPAVLEAVGALQGRPQSGNLAMCLAAVLIHAREFLAIDTSAALAAWVELHLARMNRFGFWGDPHGMTHLQFQNGYHQYEIFEYLHVENPKLAAAKQTVAGLADSSGHFAPYPGGSGCYDYDAVFVLTAGGHAADAGVRVLLATTAGSILEGQGQDGGFCESRHVRPRTIANVRRFGGQLASAWNRPSLFIERLRYALTLQRPKHDEIHSHWSAEGRGWNESNIWDTYFRMLTVARIDVALSGGQALSWGFIPYPGIGYHAPLVAEFAE
jgi:hypothetical protein